MISAVRLNGMQFTGARAFGPALAGLVLAQFGPGTAFLANALSFLLVIGALLLIAPRPVTGRTVAGSVLSHFRDGIRYVRKRAVLIVAILGALLSSLLGVSMIQLAEPFTASGAPRGRGQVRPARRGRTAWARSPARSSRWRAATRSAVRRSPCSGSRSSLRAEITFGLAPAYALALLGLFGIGLAQVFAMVSCQTAVQVNVDEHYRGRVLSIYVMCFFAGTPIGALVGRDHGRGRRAAGHHRRFRGPARGRGRARPAALPGVPGARREPLGLWITRWSATVRRDLHGSDLDTAAHLIVEPLD